jgi:hypothetical protein
VRLAQENVPNTVSGTAHLTRLLLRDGFVYGANSSAGVMAWRIAAVGWVTVSLRRSTVFMRSPGSF